MKASFFGYFDHISLPSFLCVKRNLNLVFLGFVTNIIILLYNELYYDLILNVIRVILHILGKVSQLRIYVVPTWDAVSTLVIIR